MFKVTIVHDKVTEKPRGYAFVEFEHERDMHGKCILNFQAIS